jgi:hypothetical protein
MAKGRVMNKRTKRYVVRPAGNSRASLPIETGTYSRTNPLGEMLAKKRGRGSWGTRTGVTEEGAA